MDPTLQQILQALYQKDAALVRLQAERDALAAEVERLRAQTAATASVPQEQRISGAV